MPEDTSSSKLQPPKQFWKLLNKYLTLSEKFEQQSNEIEIKARKQLTGYLFNKTKETDFQLLNTDDFVAYIDEFVEYLIIYYAYYRSIRRSLATLFASIGITDHQIFAEMVRSPSDPCINIELNDLDAKSIDWFINQFLDDYQAVNRNLAKLSHYLPKLEEAVARTYSRSMQKFLDVLHYATSDEAIQLRNTGYDSVQRALDENDLNRKINLVIQGINQFVKDAQNHPTFILTESPGYFGVAEQEEFDKKITSFKKIHEAFKEHVSLSNRTRWIYRRHHSTLFSSIFEGSHFDLLDFRDKIREGAPVDEFQHNIRDCQEMLLGVSQAFSLFLEYSAYSKQMLTLVEAYRQIADFLQSELVQILYSTELDRNQLYLKMHEEFHQTLDGFQQTLLSLCSLDSPKQ